MKLEKLIEQCNDMLQKAANEREDLETYEVFAIVDTEDGYIDLEAVKDSRGGKVIAIVGHDDNGHDSPLLEKYIEANVSVDWDVADETVSEAIRDFYMDEYQRNGFASAADFWRWKEG